MGSRHGRLSASDMGSVHRSTRRKCLGATGTALSLALCAAGLGASVRADRGSDAAGSTPRAYRERPPVIATGWDSPGPRQFREGLAVFEGWGVFDGTTLRATRRTPAGADEAAIFAFSREPWAWKEFAGALADLRAARPTTCRENYLTVYSNPGDVDWFDDAGWRAITEHWRLLSRLARQGGLRGLLFDAEPYTPPHSQFLYRAQAQRDRHSFAEYRAMARRRGREVMEAVCDEFPEASIFAYRLFSDMLGLLDSGDLERAIEPHTYGLLPAFVDGWLDVMPPTMRVIEGTEDIGYRANSFADYSAAFAKLKLRLPEFVAPEHREKVRRQFLVGQSLYLDAYMNPPDSPWYIDRLGGTPAARLAANVASALAASDGVVWLYGETARWWPSGDPTYPPWPERLPGAIAAIRRAKDPAGFAREVFRRDPAPPNLLPNGDFSEAPAPDGPPASWWQWQDDASHGQVRSTAGQVELRDVLDGVVGCTVTVQPGRNYAVRLRVRTEGRGLASLNIGWKDAAGAWTAHARNRRLVGTDAGDAAGWREIVGLVEVPPGATQLVFMAGAAAQLGDADRCWFDDASLVEVEE